MQILIRLAGEMVVKSSQVRHQFQKQLIRNIKDAFKAAAIPMVLRQEWSRLYIQTDHEEAIDLLKRIFGIQSFSIIEEECASELEEIVVVGLKRYASYVADKTFAVKAKRTGSQTFSSMDVQRRLGGALNQETTGQVNLSHPERPVYVEVRPEITYFYSKSIKGAGGLPLATGGQALCLISGGFDSAVAAWMIQKRGVKLDYLLCNLAGEAYERSVLMVAKHLADHWSYGHRPRIYVLDFQKVSAELKDKVTSRYTQVILKRLFYRAAEAIAAKARAQAIITGEAIGQVSSQTLTNLGAIDEATSLPVLRPLVAFDKEDIIAMSRNIGTFDLCASIQEFCQLVPDKPATVCKVETARSEEEKVDLAILSEAVEQVKVLALRDLSSGDLTTPYIFRDTIPSHARVIDCRPRYEYDKWHYTDAMHREFYDLLENYKSLDKKETYLVYCDVGMQSALVAEKMQADGFLAYSLRGGVSTLVGPTS